MLGISKNTVKKALDSNEFPKYKRVREVEKKTDKFTDAIIDMYYNKDYIGTRIFDELKKLGYEGSINGVYRFLSTLERRTPKKTSMRYETDMGKQAQFDWSPYTVNIGGKRVNILLYSMILGYSRKKAVCIGLDEKASTVYQAIEICFRKLGGVAEKLLIDNDKAMVIKNDGEGNIEFNNNFLNLAAMYSFEPVACHPYTPRTKGKIERPFSYIEEHFIKGNEFSSMEELSNAADTFIEEYDNKIHSTTLEKPIVLYEDEKSCLKPCPPNYFYPSLKEHRRVSWDCLVSVDGTRYSVPYQYANKSVWIVRYIGYEIDIYSDAGNVIAKHKKSDKKGATVIDKSHYEGLYMKVPQSVPEIRNKFKEVFTENGEAFFSVMEQRMSNYNIHGQNILKQRILYEDKAIDEVLGKALEYGIYNSSFVRNLLKKYPLKKEEISMINKKENINTSSYNIRSMDYYRDLTR
jgi:transposase